MFRKPTTSVLTLLLTAGMALAMGRAPQAEKPVQIVLLGGQSNMAGCGNYNTLSDEDKTRIKAVAERVQITRSDNLATTPPEPLSYFTSQYQFKNRGFAECFGPELFIGVTLAEQNPDREYLLIKTAVGGTTLYGCWNPDWSAEKVQAVEKKGYKWELKLYNQHHTQIQQALEKLHAQGRAYEIIGMAWMQGENDAAEEVSARAYETNLKKLINGYRQAFNVPEMPFVAGQINSHYGRFPGGPEMVRAAFLKVADADRRMSVIKTAFNAPWNDFPKHTDNVHYNTEGQKRLGTAMGQALLTLNNQP